MITNLYSHSIEAKELRDSYSQQKYREQSQSENKSKQDVSHIVSLEIASQIQSHTRGPANVTDLKDCTNSSENFRMVSTPTNRKDHREIDKALMEKSETSEPLTQREEARARRQVDVLQGQQDELPPGFYKQAKATYKSMKTQDGKTVWDGRHDKKK